MFEKLVSKTVHKVEQSICVSFPLGVEAIEGGSRILNHLYSEEVNDYTMSRYSERRPPSPRFEFEWFQALEVRFLSRVTAYVVVVCSLDGILIQSYKHFLARLPSLRYATLAPSDQGSELLSARKAEIKDYYFYRNKVFAHTSFADPRDDSPALQHSSLLYYAGNLLYRKEEHLSLGGGSVIVDGKEEEVPQVSIVGGYQEIIDHYLKWETMFIDVLDKVPLDELTGRLEAIRLLVPPQKGTPADTGAQRQHK
jgi:hypothetical protein